MKYIYAFLAGTVLILTLLSAGTAGLLDIYHSDVKQSVAVADLKVGNTYHIVRPLPRIIDGPAASSGSSGGAVVVTAHIKSSPLRKKLFDVLRNQNLLD